MISQSLWPLSGDMRPRCNGLSAPEGKALGREGAWPSPAINADCLLAACFTEGTISTEVPIHTAEPPLKPQVSAQNA